MRSTYVFYLKHAKLPAWLRPGEGADLLSMKCARRKAASEFSGLLLWTAAEDISQRDDDGLRGYGERKRRHGPANRAYSVAPIKSAPLRQRLRAKAATDKVSQLGRMRRVSTSLTLRIRRTPLHATSSTL